MNTFKLPKDKLNAVVNYFKIMTFYDEVYLDGKKPSTKSKLHFFAFPIIKSNIFRLKSNLKFIRRFRHFSLINSEDDYFLALFQEVIFYIDGLNPADFEKDEVTVQSTIDLKTNTNLSNEKLRISELKEDNILKEVLEVNVEELFTKYFSQPFHETQIDTLKEMQVSFAELLDKIKNIQSNFGLVDSIRESN